MNLDDNSDNDAEINSDGGFDDDFDDEVDPFDPLVADRFRLLDNVDPQDFAKPGPAPAGNDGRWEAGPSRLRYLVGAAAAATAIVGLSALVLAGTGGDQDLEATTGGDVQLESNTTSGSGSGSGAADEGADGNASLQVEVPATPPTAGTSESAPTTAVTAPAETTAIDPSDRSSVLKHPTPDKMVIVRGQVTEVFTDCRSRLILNAAGEVETVGPISCDGGSHIVVNGTKIQTSSGFVAAEDAYDKHPAGLLPGRSVTVTAIPAGATGGRLTLDCVQCGVALGG